MKTSSMSPGAPRRRALPHRVAAILVALRLSLGFSGGAVTEPVHIGRMAAGDSGMVSEVLVADEVPLREAIEKGGTVTLSFDGMLNLTRPLVIAKDVVLDATGHQVLLSGNQQVRVLEVQPDVRLTLRNVTIAHGRSDRGGGLFNDGGSITLVDCVFTNNRAIGTPGTNGAVLPHTTDPILPETLVGGWGGPGLGGAILSRGALRASNCVFIANLAEGGAGGSGGQVLPTPTGSWSMTEPRWKDGTQGFGGRGGEAWGGAIHQETG
ncbi:MAG: hypothetical protein L6Q38_13740, partial [Nitrospira sp.]|nr:hypothetical protein [Nitrospira sp.]